MIPQRLRRLPLGRGSVLYVLLAIIPPVGVYTGWYDLYHHLGLNPVAVWHGELWRLLTYPFLPLGMIDFLVGAWSVLWLGTWLEREWSAAECWLYGGIATTASGIVACLLFPRLDGYLGGTVVVVTALLVMWVRLCGHQRIMPVPGYEATVRGYATAWGCLIVLIAWFSCGRWLVLPMIAASAATGWAYLSLRWRWLERAAHRAIEIRRTRNLEL